MKIVVLSDLHLGGPGVAVNGLDPAARLAAAVEMAPGARVINTCSFA